MIKKTFVFAFIAILVLSCKPNVTAGDMAKLNGYWEIEKVVFPDGSEKAYTINESYDYFEIKNNNGFRQKVMPQLDGTFLTNNISESIAIKEKEGKYSIDFSTPYAKWSEEIMALTDDKLVLLNPSKKKYHYKRTQPINLLNDGKKTQ